ncbi:MAG: CBS domain-containing protein [Bacillota bacterium]
MQVKEIMTKDPVIIDVDSDVNEAARLLSYYNIGRLLVVKNNELVGIVTDGDLMIEHDRDMPIKDFMTENLITVKEDDSIAEAASILKKHKISGMPVVNEEGHLAGIITVEDIVYRYVAKNSLQNKRER